MAGTAAHEEGTSLEGYVLRRPQQDDVDGVAELAQLCEEADFGAAQRSRESVQAGWRLLDLEQNAWVMEDPGGIIGFAGLLAPQPVRIFGYVLVSPQHRARGIGTQLVGLLDARAAAYVNDAPAGAEVTLNQDVGPLNAEAARLLEANGYEHVRRFWEMGIDLTSEVPQPAWPEGVRLETLVPGEDREVYDMMREAFRDHWGFNEHPYEEWRVWMVERDSFDPSLWFLARAGSELVGASACYVREDGAGWVNGLGVLRAYRRRGLGMALLRHSFREFRSRELKRAGLGVDSENLTGATRLYERAGMEVVRHSDTFQKVLRPAA